MQTRIVAGKDTMLFYTSLFIASLFAAFVALWAYHAITNASQAVLKTILPAHKSGPTSHLGPKTKRSGTNGKRTPWGWKSHDTPANLAKTHAAKPASMRANPYIARKSETAHTPNAVWVQREERSELGGSAYKVTRSAKATAAGFKTSERPWGW
jgi:hypothetical protein